MLVPGVGEDLLNIGLGFAVAGQDQRLHGSRENMNGFWMYRLPGFGDIKVDTAPAADFLV